MQAFVAQKGKENLLSHFVPGPYFVRLQQTISSGCGIIHWPILSEESSCHCQYINMYRMIEIFLTLYVARFELLSSCLGNLAPPLQLWRTLIDSITFQFWQSMAIINKDNNQQVKPYVEKFNSSSYSVWSKQDSYQEMNYAKSKKSKVVSWKRTQNNMWLIKENSTSYDQNINHLYSRE